MNNTERILQTLSAAPGVLCDDCISRLANVLPRQQVNAIAARLFDTGRIFRHDGLLCSHCGRIKKGSAFFGSSLPAPSPILPLTPLPLPLPQQQIAPIPPKLAPTIPARNMNSTRPWHWEGNVQVMLRRFLEGENWKIKRFADTESKESGIDLEAAKGGRELLFEVKGYPTTVYDHGPDRGQFKATPPSSQARQWYSHALLKMMLLREQHPGKEVALCFPDFLTYRRLIAGTCSSLQALDVAVYLVTENGDVSVCLGQVEPAGSA